jgi:nucleotide-binding universal stress UspA family protein
MVPTKILVPLDGSDTAAAVIPFVLEISSQASAKLVLVTAVQQVGVWDATLTMQVMEREEELAQQYLAEQAEQLRAAGASVDTRITRGEAAEGVLSIADSEGADLVAISTHGRSGVSRWLFGSVASRILQSCTTPVLFLHPKTGEDKGAPGPVIKKILVPLDGSDLAGSIVPEVEEFARSMGASLVFFNAVSPITTYPGFETAQATSIGQVIQELQEQSKLVLSRAAEHAILSGVEATIVVTLDTPVDGVIHAAEDVGADLIAVATHGRGGFGRAVLGSVADGVVRRSTDRPVLVIRPPAES